MGRQIQGSLTIALSFTNQFLNRFELDITVKRKGTT